MKQFHWSYFLLMVFLALVIFLGRGLFLEPQKLPSAKLGKMLPDFQLNNLLKPEQMLTAKDIKGHFSLLNVWASWCPSCPEEQDFLMMLADKGILIYGLNWEDSPEAAHSFLETWGNPYQWVAMDQSGRLAIELGVYGAPETFLIDKQGRIRYRYAGVLNQSVWEREIQPVIRQLESDG